MDRTAASSTDRPSRAGGSSQTRREFLGTVPGLALVAGTGISAQVAGTGTQAQQIAPPRRIGALWYTRHKPALLDAVLRRILKNHCWRLDEREPDLEIVDRFGDWKRHELKTRLEELVGNNPPDTSQVELILAGDSIAGEVAKEVLGDGSLPIVFYIHSDPVKAGLVKSLAQPDTNTTGATNLSAEATRRRLELLGETIPGLHHLAVVGNPVSESVRSQWDVAVSWVRQHGPMTALEFIALDDPDKVPAELERMSHWTQAMLILSDPITSHKRGDIAKFALERRIATMFGKPEGAHDGGLMAYAADRLDLMADAADRIDAILRSGKTEPSPTNPKGFSALAAIEEAGRLPVAVPDKLDFIINLKTARAIGCVIPTWVMAQADVVLWNEAPTWYVRASDPDSCAPPMFQ